MAVASEAAGGPLRLGVLGCSGFARRRMLPAMAAHPRVRVHAVASRSAGRAAATAAPLRARPVTGYGELLADPALDAVYLPLPAVLHAPWVEAALSAGKHVLAEKPLTTDPGQTRALLARARSLGLVLHENTLFVHHGQHAVVRRLLAEGAIGELRALHAAFTVPAPAPGDIRYAPELGGGCLADIGLYPVRAAVHLLGARLDVVGAVLSSAPGQRVETSGAALLRRADGVTAQLTFGMEHAYRSRYELWGSEGRITVDRAFTPAADHRPGLLVERADGTRTLSLPAEDQAVAALTAFADSVREGKGGADNEPDLLAQAELLARVRQAAGG
ncbi:Gfo/Idh/MocA family protein [Streptomyces diastaticus]|uniref:Gfo/Idh/MocA family protein n=1 Tax=Streptomyces diastaticus TaxID=1956 RepID=UPI00344B2139